MGVRGALRKLFGQLIKSISLIEVYLLVSIFLFALIIFACAFLAFDGKADTIQNDLNSSDKVIEMNLKRVVPKDEVSDGLLAQYNYLKFLKKQHLETARSYEVLYFTCTFCFLFFSILTALLVFLMTRRGWENASGTFKASFLIAAFLTTLVGAIPRVFEHEKDASSNIAKYFEYTKLQVEIFYTIKSTEPITSDSTKMSRREQTFLKITEGIVENNNLFINLSPPQSSIAIDYLKNLEK